MTQTTAPRLRRLASPRRQDTAGGTGRRAAALLLRLACAALLAWIGYIHLHLADYAQAVAHYQMAVDVSREMGSPFGLGNSLPQARR